MPTTNWLDPVWPSLVEVKSWQQATASAIAVTLGALGILTAWLLYSKRAVRVPRPWALFEERFYFDWLYDRVFYRPSGVAAPLLYAPVAGPIVGGSVAGTGT